MYPTYFFKGPLLVFKVKHDLVRILIHRCFKHFWYIQIVPFCLFTKVYQFGEETQRPEIFI